MRQRLFTVEAITYYVSQRRASFKKRHAAHYERLVKREQAVVDTSWVVARLYKLVEEGLEEVSDPQFKERFTKAKVENAAAERELIQVRAELPPDVNIAPDKTVSFVTALVAALDDPSITKRRAVLRSVIDEISVGADVIRIAGRTSLGSRCRKGCNNTCCSAQFCSGVVERVSDQHPA